MGGYRDREGSCSLVLKQLFSLLDDMMENNRDEMEIRAEKIPADGKGFTCSYSFNIQIGADAGNIGLAQDRIGRRQLSAKPSTNLIEKGETNISEG